MTTRMKLRQTLRESSDPRTERTRVAVLEAVEALHSQGLRVTVAALVREAGISRSGFYAHFSGLDDVASALLHDSLSEIASDYEATMGTSPAQSAHAMHEAQRRLVAHFAHNRALYLAVSGLSVSGRTRSDAVRILAEVLVGPVLRHPRRPADADPVLTARYISGAAIALLEAWITGEVEADAETVALHLTRLMPRWFSGIEPDPVE